MHTAITYAYAPMFCVFLRWHLIARQRTVLAQLLETIDDYNKGLCLCSTV